MAEIISNTYVGEGCHLLKAQGHFEGKMGQFYMVRGWDVYPILSRPLSIHDRDHDSISFLYRVVGNGTRRLSRLEKGDHVQLEGPYGNGFPEGTGRVALVGGGMGSAPLYLAAKTLRKNKDVKKIDVYMGFRKKAILEDAYKKYGDQVIVSIGQPITDLLKVEGYDVILTCGPEPMMEKIQKLSEHTETRVYVSLEKRMACGLGACLVCTCETKEGNKKTCKDGPVFLGKDVFNHDKFTD